MTAFPAPSRVPGPPETVTGVQLARGVGVRQAKGFWTEAMLQVIRRPGAICGLAWLSVVIFFAVFAPYIANGHPIILQELDAVGNVVKTTHPFWESMRATDYLLPTWLTIVAAWCFIPVLSREKYRARLYTAVAVGAVLLCGMLLLKNIAGLTGNRIVPPLPLYGGVAALFMLLLARATPRDERFATLFICALLSGAIVVGSELFIDYASGREIMPWVRSLRQHPNFGLETAAAVAGIVLLLAVLAPLFEGFVRRIAILGPVCLLACVCVAGTSSRSLDTFDYRDREARGEVRATYTIIPWSPLQRRVELNTKEPGTPLWNTPQPSAAANPTYILGTDSLGQDVLSQMLHACRLSISIGLVSTGISVLIGVTIGALMGYFGGIVDIVLSRVLEVFLSIPVLFLLIVAAAVLPKNTYVMMIIIGCVTWTGAARFIRAEFYKLRGQDFVQSAKAVGLPLRSILFKHMLPNGVTPVLVDSSFAIAAAILAEATLSYLGLGPEGQPSWGQLLSDATGQTGTFLWWLAIFPGFAIFLTVLSYNMIGEALRDAIDPKLKKARV